MTDVEIKLQELLEVVERDAASAELVCEFVDRRNAGEKVCRGEILDKTPESIREAMAEDLYFVECLLDLGKFWRERARAGT